MSNNTFALPQCVGKRKPRLLLTRFVGYGSTGNVWKCRFDNCDDSESFAVKIVETLRCSDADSRQRLRNEFKVYRILERAHQSGKLRDRIVPHCYGAFESEGADALILDFCDNTLKEWDELTASERWAAIVILNYLFLHWWYIISCRDQVFKLVQDLHGVGILHGDLEPRNIVRARGGGFRLIDFTESRKHTCKEFTATVRHVVSFSLLVADIGIFRSKSTNCILLPLQFKIESVLNWRYCETICGNSGSSQAHRVNLRWKGLVLIGRHPETDSEGTLILFLKYLRGSILISPPISIKVYMWKILNSTVVIEKTAVVEPGKPALINSAAGPISTESHKDMANFRRPLHQVHICSIWSQSYVSKSETTSIWRRNEVNWDNEVKIHSTDNSH